MDKQKQIERMAKTMCPEWGTEVCANECAIIDTCSNTYIANRLYEAGYRKADDVIDHLMQAKDTSELTEKEIEFFVKHNEKVRKETAKEIYNWLNEHAYYEEEIQLVNAFHEAFLEDEE